MTTHTAATMTKCQCGTITRTEWTARWFGGWEEFQVGPWQWELPRTAMKSVICRGCGEQVKKGSKRIVGKLGTQDCNDKCMSSTSGACECRCEGRNHGGSHAA